MKLIFSRFDSKKKVSIIYSMPNQNLSDEIHSHLKKIQDRYIDETNNEDLIWYKIGPYLSYVFQIESAWYPEEKEKLMLTLYFEEHENTHFFKPIIENTVSNLRKISNLSKVLFVNTPHADNESFIIFGKLVKHLTNCYFEASKLHSTYNLGLSEILILGDKGSGKTSIVDYLIHGKFIPQTSPTLTPQVFQLVYNQVDFRVLDICCKAHLREIFEDHPIETGKLPQGIVYVIDSTQTEQEMKQSLIDFQEWTEFLFNQYPEEIFLKIPFLILFNKIDLNPQFNFKLYKEKFKPRISNLNLKYSTSSAKNGIGLNNNFNWMIENIRVTEKY